MEKSQKAESSNTDAADEKSAAVGPSKAGAATQRKIPGNLPYLTASGTLKKALDRLIEASRPDKFNSDFLENVLKLSGGSARATIPILKRLGFLTSDGVPTDLYARFRTEGGRGPAALQALRTGFPEIFKRSEYAHSVEDGKLRDIIVEITGLKPSDTIVLAIKATFNVVKSYIPAGMDNSSLSTEEDHSTADEPLHSQMGQQTALHIRQQKSSNIGLVYNINIVLPETSDLRVLNAIFRSLKENLMQ
ncbi:DUF5343 domain-containing protein [Aminobacter aminovorans]|uniref:DUF5343 domain-containing protein n=1 Tax=Aminobacter aminovorans TaxID=83263 RepID=UPI002861A18C|nr:DUF5343 domain-containing protein [Aminobacter aminovorans]MDR7221215.1 hypothetical protein [Aminobacter aminovorans]